MEIDLKTILTKQISCELLNLCEETAHECDFAPFLGGQNFSSVAFPALLLAGDNLKKKKKALTSVL